MKLNEKHCNLWQVMANSWDFGTQPVKSFLTRENARNFISFQKERLLVDGFPQEQVKNAYAIRKTNLIGRE